MKKIALAVALSMLGAGTSLAADMAVKAPPAPLPPPCIWCGFYIGANAGWVGSTGNNNSFAASTLESGADPTPIFFSGNNFNNQNTNGGFGGGQIGYNWAWPGAGAAGYGWLVGVEADIQGASLHRSSPALFVSEVGEPGDVSSFRADSRLTWFGTLRGRVGVTSGPVLFYGTGGLAFGGVNHNLLVSFNDTTDCGFAAGCAVAAQNSTSDNRWGWVAGVGIEWMFAPNWSVKGEYQYIDLGSVTRTATALVTTDLGGEVEGVTAIRRQNERFNTVRIGVNYHFGGPAVGRY